MTSREIKNNLGHEVTYEGRNYLFSAYTLRYIHTIDEIVPQCELVDLKALSSLIYANPIDVQAIKR